MAADSRASWARSSLRLSVLWGVQLIDVLVVTSVIPAIPQMLASTGAPEGAATLVAAATAMSFAGLLLFGARAGDRYGHRRLLLVGMTIFAAASVVGATADTIAQLVAARAGQGVAAALALPSAMWALLRVSEEPRRRRTALAGWSASGAVAGILGYVVGGGLTQALSWHWVFWINVPITIVLMIGLYAVVPGDSPEPGARLDATGAVLLTAAVMSLVGGASVLQDAQVLLGTVALLAGCVFGWGFVRQQRRADDPLIPRSSWHDRNLRTGVVVSFINTATTSGIGILVILALQYDLGLSPARSALILMPFSAAVVVGSVASRLPSLVGSSRRPMAFGLAGIGLGGLTLAVAAQHVPATIAGLTVAGFGLGLASVGATSIATTPAAETGTPSAAETGTRNAAEPDARGSEEDSSAVGLLNTSAQMGNALGIAALHGVAALPHSGPTIGYLVVAVAGLVTAAAVVRPARHRTESPATRN